MTTSYASASSTENLINSLGVNTHIDFPNSAYTNVNLIDSAIEYIGVKNLRDAPNSPADLGATGLWQQVANATGAKFDAYLGEGSISAMTQGLANAVILAKQGIVNFIEGGDEEDAAYAVSQGNSLATAAAYQKTVYSTAHSLGIPVINMSFGTGWATSPTGDYGTVGNLSAYADYANAHTYFGTGNTPYWTIQSLNSDAHLAAPSDPVITTEMGWYTTSSTTDVSNDSVMEQAKYMLDGVLDAYQAGDVKTYLYELFDQGTNTTYSEDNFGLFYANGTAKPAAVALHNLTTLLADTGATAASFTPTGLSYQLSGTIGTDHSLLLEKSDGSFWLAVWNEARLSGPTSPAPITVANHTVTLTLGNIAQTVEIYDPLTGTTATQTASNVSTLALSVPDHPILVEIIPGSTTAPAPPPPGNNSAATPSDLAVIVPATADTAYVSQTTLLAGVSISDAWASAHGGSMALNLTAAHGAIQISNGTVIETAAAGTTLTLTGSLTQLNADLATLSYAAGNPVGSDKITVDVWNQGGVEATQTLAVTVAAAPPAVTAQDLAIMVPATSPQVSTTAYTAIGGVSVGDAWTTALGSTLSLTLGVSHGTLQISNGSSTLQGSTLSLNGTPAQLDTELQTLQYEATSAAGTDTLSITAANHGGASLTHALYLIIG